MQKWKCGKCNCVWFANVEVGRKPEHCPYGCDSEYVVGANFASSGKRVLVIEPVKPLKPRGAGAK